MDDRQIAASLADLVEEANYLDNEQLGESMRELLDELGVSENTPPTTFRRAGVMTDDAGVVIQRLDGTKLYLTVKTQNR